MQQLQVNGSVTMLRDGSVRLTLRPQAPPAQVTQVGPVGQKPPTAPEVIDSANVFALLELPFFHI